MRQFAALTLLIAVSLTASLCAQKLDLHQFKGMKIRNIGPAGMSGRVTSIDAVHAEPDIIYIGTASGGLWKSESGGVKWEPIFDDQPTASIGAIAIDQRNPDIIWAGTGEGNPRNSQSSGNGIFRSANGGRTWTCMGLKESKTIHRIIVHPENSDIVWAASIGSAWGPNPDRGVFKTTDGGKTWTKSLFVNDTTGCADLIIDPSNPNKLFAAMWHYHREPWFFTSGGKGSALYMTEDGGENWTPLGEKQGLPKGKIGRIGLSISPSSPNIVYALVEAKKTGLYRSDDGGYKWKKQADKNIGNRPFYYADIFVDPQNENRLYNLHSIVTVSEDGGKTFSNLITWSSGVHPDHHAFWIHPSDPNFLIDGNDGGLAISRDRGKTWRFVENLPLAQFYHINYDEEIPYNVMGGMQDNGSWIGPSEVWMSGGIQNHHWQEIAFGDGFDVMTKPDDNNIAYAMSQGGWVNRINRTTGHQTMIKPLHPEGQNLRYNWNAPIAQDPFDPNTIYFGSQFVHKSTDVGDSWVIISPDLTTNDSTKQQQAKSGGLTIDATQAENYTSILAIAPSPLQRNLIWASTDDGRLHLTTNGGKNWTDLYDRLPGAPKGAWVPQIEVSRHAAGEAFVIVNDYRRNNWKPYAYHTRDYGKTWRRIADDQKVDGFTVSIVQDPAAERLLFLGTDHGLWLSLDAGETWNKWTEGFPSVQTSDLKIHPRTHDLIVGTFGRAAWILDDITPLRELAQKGASLLDKPFHVFPGQPAILAEYKSVQGSRFGGQGEFAGTNPTRGAITNVWIKEKEKKEEKEKAKGQEKNKKSKKDSKDEQKKESKGKKKGKTPNFDHIKIHVLDARQDTIRTYFAKADTGLVRVHWNLRSDGIKWPSYRESPINYQMPSGSRVQPGMYKLVMHYHEWKDSTTVRVDPDPRIPYNAAAQAQKAEKLAEYTRYAKAATRGFEQLRDARKMMSKLEPLLGNLDESMRDSLKKEGKSIRENIKSLMELYLAPENFEGIESVTIRLGDMLWGVRYYLESAEGIPGGNSLVALNRFKKEVTSTLEKVNRFLREDWRSYRQKVEAANTPLFKDLDEIEIEKE